MPSATTTPHITTKPVTSSPQRKKKSQVVIESPLHPISVKARSPQRQREQLSDWSHAS